MRRNRPKTLTNSLQQLVGHFAVGQNRRAQVLIAQILFGVAVTLSPRLSDIGRALRERIALRYTEKRLCQRLVSDRINDDALVAQQGERCRPYMTAHEVSKWIVVVWNYDGGPVVQGQVTIKTERVLQAVSGEALQLAGGFSGQVNLMILDPTSFASFAAAQPYQPQHHAVGSQFNFRWAIALMPVSDYDFSKALGAAVAQWKQTLGQARHPHALFSFTDQGGQDWSLQQQPDGRWALVPTPKPPHAG